MNLRKSVNMGLTHTRAADGESFIPLAFFPTFGGLGKEATIFCNCLEILLSQKHNNSYHQTLSCSLSFSLLCSAMLAIRGSRKCHAAGSAFCYLHWAVLGGELGIILKHFVYFYIGLSLYAPKSSYNAFWNFFFSFPIIHKDILTAPFILQMIMFTHYDAVIITNVNMWAPL